ncbi:monooxygenase [Hoeflea sp. WL0058]|uniref:Monooxygenase n=1 Tax=Flavimaribacter sediminis TaxID=2865987 RepID=A0AAE2ZR51_9HYPH|nr:styrene monooxygenase/indole monooxygenase family protein [Flavimaribacter sediminis]MBW8638057.1 monooxygenase [Flavimaribacter sediminis]
MHKIGIVGAGIAGLHLALYLQQRGVDATIITDRTPEELAKGRLLNTVAHHHTTLAREEALGVNHWPDPNQHYYYHDHWLNIPGSPLNFSGRFSKPSRAVDYRIYLPALMEDFTDRGGVIEYGRIEEDDIAALVDRFDLLVVSTGKGPLGAIFSHDPDESPFQQPQRRLSVGLYSGVRHTDPMNVTLSLSPGAGELIVIPTITFDGVGTALLMENVPGGPLEQTVTTKYDDGPAAFRQTVLEGLEQYHPAVYDRIDTTRFDLCQPNDLLQGGLVPTVRKTSVEFDNGKFAIALGDVHVTVDPVNGQGANIASYAAFVMGEEIMKAPSLDRRFVEHVDMARNDRCLGAARWSNLMMAPPSEEMQMLLGAMSQNKALCDEFTENFNWPERQWDNLSSPTRIRSWIERSAPARAAE